MAAFSSTCDATTGADAPSSASPSSPASSEKAAAGKKLAHLVLDAGALIRITDLSTDLSEHLRHAESVVTIPDVLSEIRDKKSRRNLANNFPFGKKLVVREPSQAAVQRIVQFAKSSGDLRALSKPDVRLMALTYMLHVEEHGAESTTSLVNETAHRDAAAQGEESATKVVVPKVAAVKPGVSWAALAAKSRPQENVSGEDDEGTADGFVAAGHFKGEIGGYFFGSGMHGLGYYRDETSKGIVKSDAEVAAALSAMPKTMPVEAKVEAETNDSVAWPSLSTLSPSLEAPKVQDAVKMAESQKRREAFKAASEATKQQSIAKREAAAKEAQTENNAEVEDTETPPNPLASRIIGFSGGGIQSYQLDEEDDGTGWADVNSLSLAPGTEEAASSGWGGPSAPRSSKAAPNKDKQKRTTIPAKDVRVACVTTDYTMQNVMMQLRLRVLGLSGRTVLGVKRWVLKCDACFQMCPQMDKQFCPSCGSDTLARLAYSIDEDGNKSYHYKKGRRVKVRGTKYSLPQPSSRKSRSGKAKAKGGKKFDPRLLLREDQMMTGMWSQRVAQKNNATSMFGEHVTESFGLSLTRSKGVKVGHGRRNPNAMKGRERRGKKKR